MSNSSEPKEIKSPDGRVLGTVTYETQKDVWLESSLATFNGLIFRRYEKKMKTSKDKMENGQVKKGRMYEYYSIVVSPVENQKIDLNVEPIFRDTMERIKALRIADDKAYLKVSVEGTGRNKVITWSNVNLLG